jgi:hypothetical protein
MLSDFTGTGRVYIACGYTDLRRGIDGLTSVVQQQFRLDPFTNTLFLFCGRRRDRIKALYWEGNGFVLLYKRLPARSGPGVLRKSCRTMFPLKWWSIVFRRKNGSAPYVARSCRKLARKSGVRW